MKLVKTLKDFYNTEDKKDLFIILWFDKDALPHLLKKDFNPSIFIFSHRIEGNCFRENYVVFKIINFDDKNYEPIYNITEKFWYV